MCLYPRLIKNPKYIPNKKNHGIVPPMRDYRLKYVSIGCGRCMECLRQKANEWITRLTFEILADKSKCYFVTLTFSNEELDKLNKELKKDECHATTALAVKRFCERWRKKYKKQPKHWLITELGHKNTERIHLHGLIWGPKEDILKYWKYGHVWIGEYVNNETIFYITKYVTKIDTQHKNFIPSIYASKGIGNWYWKKGNHVYIGKATHEYLRLPNGQRKGLPMYYRNHIFTEKQREQLWINRLDENTIYVNGIKCKVDTLENQLHYYKVLEQEQKKNKRIGYGDNSEEWKKKEYNTKLRDINKTIREGD